MKPKPIRLFSRAAMLLMMTLTATTAWAWSGEGTEANPYKITSANDLIQLATDVNGGETYSGKYFQQTGPITLTSEWTPIGTSAHPFKGHYDGGNNAISGLTVSGNYLYAGLFGYISSDRVNGSLVSNELQNIHIVDCNINVGSSNNSGSKAGGIAGQTGPVHLSDCRVSGTITAYNTACGLVGYADQSYGNSVTDCFVDVTVSATGKQYNQYVTPTVRLMLSVQANTPTASGNYYHDNGGSVTVDCSATPLYTIGVPSGLTVAETNAFVTFNGKRYFATNATATLTVDDADKAIKTLTATGAASSEVAANKKSATVTIGSSDVTVSATLMALTGTSDGVTWSMSDSDSDGTYDRLTLSGSGTLSTSPWATDFAASITHVDISSADIAISGNPFSTLADGVVIVAPTPAYAVSYASAAFAGKLRVAFGNYLFLATNEGGTAAYAITSDIDLQHLASAINNGSEGIANGKTFRQTADIALSSVFIFTPIGNGPTKYFSGTYDGGGYTISGLHFDFLSNVYTYGLFGYVRNGLVENVRLVRPMVTGGIVNNSYYYGALIGFADGTNGASTTIRNCVVISPDIDATKYAHGLIIGKQIDCTLQNLYVYCSNLYDGKPNKVIGEGSSGTNVGHAYMVNLGDGVSIQTEMADDLGFSYDSDGDKVAENYWREGAELTLGNALGEAPEYYAVKYTATTGTISGSTLTVGNADATVSAAIRSDRQSHSISYIDENGDDATHEAIALDETMTTLSEGWYFVGANITYTSKITLGGDVNIILADGKTMTTSSDSYGIDGYSNGYGLTIYGQALGTGTLNATGTGTNGIGIYTEGTVTINGGTLNATGTGTVGIRSIDGVTINGGTVTTTGIMADGDVTINGGKVTATDDPGISSNSGNITLGWTSADDRITASSYTDGTVTIASGKAFADEDGNIYTGTLSSDEKSKLADKTLTPACIISLPEGITATGVLAQNGTTAYAKAGDAITLAIASGYLLNGNITYTPDGGSATATTEDNGSYSFTMPAGNVTVNANIIKIISYIDADGKLQTISNYKKFPAEYNSQQNRRELTTTTLNAGEWYVVDNNITLADVEDVLTVSGSGAANIILCDGKELEYENWDSGYINGSLNIYGQSEGTGTFNYDNTNGVGHYAYQLIHGDLTIYGGQVTIAGADGVTDQNSTQCAIDGNVTIYRGSLYAKGGDDQAGFNGADAISGNVSFHGGSLMAIGGDKGSGDYLDGWGIYGKVTLDWSSASDRFYANRYGDAMTIAEGKAFADEDGNIYTGTLSSDEKSKLNGKTLTPACIISLPEGITATGVLAQNGTTAYAKAGDAITLAVASGYLLNGNITYTPDGGSATATTEDNGTYSFTMPAANVTVTATLTKLPVPELTVTDVTATTAVASWTACDGVTSYTLQLASDEQFTTGGSTTKFSEDFSGFSGNGTSDIGSNGTLDDHTSTEGWTGCKVYTASETAKIGASSGQGWIMTPALNGSGTLTVVWYAYRYGTSDKNTILLGVSENGTDFDEETITIGDEMTKYTNTFTVSGPTVYVRWMASSSSKARFFLDDISIKIVGSSDGSLIGEYTVTDGTSYNFTGLTPYTVYYARVKGRSDWSDVKEFTTATNIELADNANNTSVIEESHGLYANVTLSGRTLWKDGDWNTLCLPFAVSDFTGTPLADATVKELLTTSNLTDGTLTLNFSDDLTSIEAGRPYIVRWGTPENNPGGVIENPAFTGVTIDKTDREVTFNGGWFEGTYRPINWTVENQSILFLGEKNTLYYPKAGAHLNACRAYFLLADPNGKAREIVLNFDGNETTGILSTTNGTNYTNKADAAWYTIDGVRLSAKPTAKGLYVHGNKKVVIK